MTKEERIEDLSTPGTPLIYTADYTCFRNLYIRMFM